MSITTLQALLYAAAGTTAIAGILHLIIVPNVIEFNVNIAIFFIVSGIAQLFWAVPMIRKWGITWYAVGIGGTAVLIAMFVITRMPDNPITGRGGMVGPNAIAIEVLQAAFIGLAAAVIAYESRMKRLNKKTASDSA